MKTAVVTDEAPKATGPFSQAIISGKMVFTSGQIYLTPKNILPMNQTRQSGTVQGFSQNKKNVDWVLLEGTIEEQTHQIMKNLQAVLKGAGVDFSNVIKTTIYVTDMGVYGKINEVYGSYFSAPFPAREVVCVKALPLGATVEISMVAMKN